MPYLYPIIHQELNKGKTLLKRKSLVRSESYLRAYNEWRAGKQMTDRLLNLKNSYLSQFFSDDHCQCVVHNHEHVQRIIFNNPTHGNFVHLQFLMDYLVEGFELIGFARYEAEEWNMLLIEDGIQQSQRIFLMERKHYWQRFLPSRFIRSSRLVIEASTIQEKLSTLSIHYFPRGAKRHFSSPHQLMERLLKCLGH